MRNTAHLLWPNGSATIPKVTGEYGPRKPLDTNGDGRPDTSKFHKGIDLVGFPVVKSPVDGVVVFAGWDTYAGYLVKVQAANGDRFDLWHNESLDVVKGQRVTSGQDLAPMGDTGQSTGVHCHFEVHPNGGVAASPRDYYARHQTAGDIISPVPPEALEVSSMFPARVGRRQPIEGWSDEWMLVHPSLSNPSDSKQFGYLVTTDPNQAKSWFALVHPGVADPLDFNLPRDQYIRLQEDARRLRTYSDK